MNQNSTRNLAAAILLLTGLALSYVQADTLKLTDGSVLNGQIDRIEGGNITLNTAYAGIITVKQAQVAEVITTEPVFVQTGQTTVFGTISTSIEGLKVEAEEATLNTEVAKVDAVWRSGDQSPQEIAMARTWSYNAGLGMTGASGNTDRFGVLANFRAGLKGPDDRLTFYASYDRSENDGDITANEIKGGVDYDRKFSEKFSWYVRTELESDDAENLDLRSTAAGGVGYLWKDTDAWHLQLRGGLAYRYESFKDGTTNDVPGMDLVLLNSYTFGKVGTMKNVITYNPAFEDFGNYRLFQETTFEMPIGSGNQWKLQIGEATDYNSRPNPGFESLDITYFTRFLLEWK